MSKFWDIIKDTLIDPDTGKGSWSRVGSAIALANAIGWIWLIVWRKGEIPGLEGTVVFVCSFYAINQFKVAFRSYRDSGRDIQMRQPIKDKFSKAGLIDEP